MSANKKSFTTSPLRMPVAVCLTLLVVCTLSCAGPSDATWAVAGQQGLVRFIIVPQDKAREREAYEAQIKKLCEPDRTCFLNFYTNSKNAALSVPLLDAIEQEATAVFRRSSKQGAERFQWSCRLKVTTDPCF
jgi:hypothetical protein